MGGNCVKYLRVKNWDKLQHPSPKPLPWIKFFTALLNPTKETSYSDWPDHTKALLHHIWLMARVHGNRIPETWLTRERLNLKSKINLRPLIAAGFVWFEDEDGKILDSGLGSGLGSSRDSLTRARVARSGVSESQSLGSSETESSFNPATAFESVWSDYPRPLGRKEAFRHFCESVKSEADLAEIRTALAKYKACSDVRRGFVKHGSTWFNNWRDYLNLREEKHDRTNDRAAAAAESRSAGSGAETSPQDPSAAADRLAVREWQPADSDRHDGSPDVQPVLE